MRRSFWSGYITVVGFSLPLFGSGYAGLGNTNQNYFLYQRGLAMLRKFLILFLMILVIGISINSDAQEKIPVPEFYGIYMVSNGKLITPKDAVEEKRLKTVGHLYSSHFGITELSSISLLPNSFFLLYGESLRTALHRLKLGKFEFAERVLIKGMWPVEDEWYTANMWVLKGDVPMNVGPVKGQAELFRLVPVSPLSDGVYALYVGPVGGDLPISAMEIELVADFVVGQIHGIPEIPRIKPTPQVPSEIHEKITIALLTRGMADDDYFREREETFNVSFDDAWDTITKYFANEKFKFRTSDRERGIIITDIQIGKFGNLKSQYAVLFERLAENSIKITVKGFAWNQNEWGQWQTFTTLGRDGPSNDFLNKIREKLQTKVKRLSLSSPPDLQTKDTELQKLKAFITNQWKQVVQIPDPKRSWRELVTLAVWGKYDDYSSLYLLGVNRRGLANDALVSADKFLKKGNLKNAQKYADLATRHYIESNELFKASEQVFSGSVSMTAQILEALYRGPKEASKYGWFLMCGPKCYEVADYVFLMTDFAVDYGLEGMDEAKKNLITNAFVKTLLKTGGVSKWIENRTTHLVGESGLYGVMNRTINSPEFQKAFMKVVAKSGAYATKEMAETGAKTVIDNSINFIKGSSNLKPKD